MNDPTDKLRRQLQQLVNKHEGKQPAYIIGTMMLERLLQLSALTADPGLGWFISPPTPQEQLQLAPLEQELAGAPPVDAIELELARLIQEVPMLPNASTDAKSGDKLEYGLKELLPEQERLGARVQGS